MIKDDWTVFLKFYDPLPSNIKVSKHFTNVSI